MATRSEYSDPEVEAAMSVMLELATFLGDYFEDIALVGGWVPYFLTGQRADVHVGSLDVDLVMNPEGIGDSGYESILERLDSRGYTHATNREGDPIPSRFVRRVEAAGDSIDVFVDFLSPEYGQTGGARRHQRVQNLLPRKARGADLVFQHHVVAEVGGKLPNGAKVTRKVKVADPLASLTMKSITFLARAEPKDAYDLYTLIDAVGVDEVQRLLKANIRNGLVREGIQALGETFDGVDGLGPTAVADFFESSGEEREIIKRRAFELVGATMDKLGP